MPTPLTAVAEDYVKAIWSATEWDAPAATVTALAQRFGTAPATVSITLKRLAGQGLVVHEPYRPIALTEAGRREAVRMVRRHRLLETFLVVQLGYRWDEVHDEAERLEHVVSDAFLDRIDDLMGHPAADPNGDPIPDAAGNVDYPAGALSLDRATPGQYLVVRVSDHDPEQLIALAGLGIRPAGLVVRRPDGVELDGRLLSLPADADREILVVPA